MIGSLLALAAVAAPLPGFPSPVLVAPQKEYVDEAYRVRVTPSAKGSRIVEEQEALGLSEDAVCGVTTTRGAWALVIPEYLPGVDLTTYTEHIVTGLGAGEPDFEAGAIEEVEHEGLDARDTSFSMSMAGLDARYRLRTYRNGDHCFQLIAWGVDGILRPGELDDLIACFGVVPGEVEGRAVEIATADLDGVGWRLRGGTWESAPLGLRVSAKGPWRIVAGPELATLSEADDVGLVMSRPDAYLTICAFRGSPEELREIRESFESAEDEEDSDVLPEPLVVPFGNGEVSFRRIDVKDGLPFRWLAGAVEADGALLLIEAWAIPAFADALEGAMPGALASIEILGDAEMAELRKELLAAPDSQFAFGETFSLRGGVATDYEARLRSVKPRGFWDYRVGAAAAELGDGIVLSGYEVETELLVQVEVLPWESVDLREAHAGSLVDEWGFFPDRASVPEPARRRVAGRDAVVTEFPDGPGHEGGRRLVTLLDAGRRIEVSFTGSLGGSEALARDSDAWLAGLSILDEVPEPIEVDGRRATLTRLGVSIEAPFREGDSDDWEGEVLRLPAQVRHLGSGYRWKGAGRREVGVMVIGSDGGMTPESMTFSVLESLAGSLGRRSERIRIPFMGAERDAVRGERVLRSGLAIAIPARGRLVLVIAKGDKDEDLAALLDGSVTIED